MCNDQSERKWLNKNWASYKKMFRLTQPLDRIRDYFGEKVALYFAFIQFYTRWLIPFSIIGLIVTFYGLGTYESNTYVQQSCELNFTLCPMCDDKRCPFIKASDLCDPVQMTYMFDNKLSFLYAVLTEFKNRRIFGQKS